jgi:hypothetical protein
VSSSLSVRYATRSDEDAARNDTRAIARLMVGSHLEAAVPEHFAPLNHAKAMQQIHHVVTTGLCLMAFDGEELIGVLGCVEYDYWFSDETLLSERFFYIKPEYRAGPAMRAILREARLWANATDKVIQLTISNFHKDRPPRNGLERIGDVLSFFPRGSAYQVAPVEKATV